MRYLPTPELQHFTSTCLSDTSLGELIVQGFIEAYQCKADRSEVKLFKSVKKKVEKLISSSPTTFTKKMASSPLGPINHASTIQLLVQLISTMNSSLPDHDFSNLQASDFLRVNNIDLVVNKINDYLLNHSLEAKFHGIRKRFWDMLDSVVNLKKCDLYSFVPDDESEVFGSGQVWTMNFFFVNKSAKKIVFFACSASRKFRYNPAEVITKTLKKEVESFEEEVFKVEVDTPMLTSMPKGQKPTAMSLSEAWLA